MSSEGNRVALIVACDRYSDPDLKQLNAPSQDAERLAKILEDPKIGNFKVLRLINEPYHTVREKIDEFVQSCNREDTILLYFSCHGIKDKNGQLYFATITTNRKRLYSTGIESNFVNNMLDQCRAQQKVVLLDCCYSGAFEKGRYVRADEEVNATQFFGKGSVVITASDSMQYAFEGDDRIENLGKKGSYFTNALVEGLETGKADANKDGKITYHELYNYIHDHVRRITPDQSPTLNTRGVEGDFVVFKNIQDNTSSAEGKPSPPPMIQDPFLQFLEEASMYLEQEQYKKAIKKFDGILALRDGHIEALNGKGLALCKLKKYEEALECFKEVLKIRPKHPEASNYVDMITYRISKERNGESKAFNKNIEQETATLEKRTEENVKVALADSTQMPSELIKRGDEFYEKAMYQEAILCYDEALKIEPRSELAWINKGNALDAKGDYKEALHCFKEASKINPNSQIYHDKIKLEHIKLGQTSVSKTVPVADPRNPYNDLTLPYYNPSLDRKNNESNQEIQKPIQQHPRKPATGAGLRSPPSEYAGLGTSSSQWEYMLSAVERKECVPIIGEGVSTPWIPSRRDIAYKWAKQHGYPFEDLSHLSKVAQFLAIQNGDELYPKAIFSNELKGIKQPNFSLEENRNTPYAVLADLNLPIYITTNYDYFMEAALESRGKKPVSEFCRWNPELSNFAKEAGFPSVFERQVRNEAMMELRYTSTSRPYRPTLSEPLVYHLYGIIDIPQSMVLTEKDYQDFPLMVNQEGNQRVLPPQIRVALSTSSLFLFGYSSDDLDFRTLSQGIINPYSASIKGGRKNLAVLSPPSIPEFTREKQLAYFSAYAKSTLNLTVYWGNTSDFFRELRDRLDDFRRGV